MAPGQQQQHTAPAFTLPPAVWLPHTSVWPFSVVVFLLLLILNGGYVVFHMLAPITVTWWMTAAYLGFVSLLLPVLVELMLVRRVNFLSAVVQQDPRLVTGDRVAFNLLKTYPCLGRCREVDTLQKSLVNLYRASFRSHNSSVVYDGGFTRRSVISCDFDAAGEQRLLMSDGGASDDYGSEAGSGRGGWETPPDPFSGPSSYGDLDRASMPPSSFDPMNHGNQQQQRSSTTNYGAINEDSSAAAGAPPRRSGLRLSGAEGVVGGGGGQSLQRALLLSGVTSAEAAAAGVGSNPNTPRGGGGGGSSYGGGGSMVSARSARSAMSVITSDGNNPGMSPEGSELHSFRGNPLEGDVQQQKRHPYLAFDPLGDNNNTAASYEDLMRGVPDTGTSLLVSLVKQISPGTPLSAVTFPVHILEPRSLLEKFADMFRHAQILVDAAAEEDPDVRIRHIAKFFLSAYYLQLGARKPYNPIHGECFGARLELAGLGGGEDMTVYFLAEQVSHHPPVTIIRAVCPGVFSYRAVYHANTSLVSINCASSVGEGTIELELFAPSGGNNSNKTYKYSMTWPILYVSGFLYGAMRLEIGGSTLITEKSPNSNSRARAQIDFARKGWISGEYDVVRCHFADSATGIVDEKRGPVFDGKWNGQIFFSPDVSQLVQNRAPIWNGPSLRGAMARLIAVDVPSCPSKQSRAVWQRLTVALRQQQVPKAVEAKHEVEQAQRAWRKALADRGEKHTPVHFLHRSQQMEKIPTKELWDIEMWGDTQAAGDFFAAQLAGGGGGAAAAARSS